MGKLNKILIVVVITGFLIGVGFLIVGAIVYLRVGKCPSEKFLSPQEAAEKAITYINQNLLRRGMTASLLNVAEENGVYKFHLKIGSNEFDSYVTKDGKLLFIEGIDMEKTSPSAQGGGETTGEVSKRDTPEVKLFLMSYCPFGLQAEKMFLPVYDLLKEKAEMAVYFVNYAMHGKKEVDENLRQYCIQKEEKEKYYNYLSCFVKAGEFKKCLSEAKIDRDKMNSCISQTDQKYKITKMYNDKSTWLNGNFPKFDVHTDLNEKYGVQGSPTIVINDKVVEVSPRSPEKFKEVICQAFNSPPKECSNTLSNDVPSPGFGGGTDSSSGGQCR
ncbi:MAG: hypothetical protein QME61_04130 [Patescibacteria group bacterium]|nr:hypothetical protein [Patescibacteria group bacterium]